VLHLVVVLPSKDSAKGFVLYGARLYTMQTEEFKADGGTKDNYYSARPSEHLVLLLLLSRLY